MAGTKVIGKISGIESQLKKRFRFAREGPDKPRQELEKKETEVKKLRRR